MTFRIDSTVLEKNPGGNRWVWNIKGIFGQGIYGTLITGAGGHGLYRLQLPDHPEDDMMTPLCAAEEFQVDVDLPPAKAARVLAAALMRLNWGPEVDRAGRIAGDAGGSPGTGKK